MHANPIELLKSNSTLQELPYKDKMCLYKVIDSIREVTEIESIMLFGSRARKTNRSDSDTDIMIITKIQLEDDMFVFNKVEMNNRLNGSNLSISLISRSEWDNPVFEESLEIKSNIEKEGIKLFI